MSKHILECSARTRADVWERLYGATFASRYYQNLGNSFLRWHRGLTLGILVLGGGAVVPGVLNLIAGLAGGGDAGWSLVMAGVVGVLLAIVSGIVVVGDFARKSAGAMSISIICARVGDDLLSLLSKMDQYKISDEDARERMNLLYGKVRDETYSSEKLGIVIKSEASDFTTAEQEAYEYMEHLKESYAYGR